MTIDNSPAQSARNLLNGIDYSALIGGPLQAAIKAQIIAARSTWRFIQEVGLNEDPKTGEKTAINVSFSYQQNGHEQKLIVPILVIVPIPAIVVKEIEIDFMANINAASSNTSENSEEENIAAKGKAKGKVGWGSFSLSADLQASYSSKKSSKATSESRYSVEYTQSVKVSAGQADIPAGLATVLNILSSSVTTARPGGEITVSPPAAQLNSDNNSAENAVRFNCSLKNDNGLYLTANNGMKGPKYGYSFTLKEIPSGNEAESDNGSKESKGLGERLQLGVGPLGKKIEWDKPVEPNADGQLLVSLWIEEEEDLPTAVELEVTGQYEENGEDRTHAQVIPLSIEVLRGTIQTTVDNETVKTNEDATIHLHVFKSDGTAYSEGSVHFEVLGKAKEAVTVAPAGPDLSLDTQGHQQLVVSRNTSGAAGEVTLRFSSLNAREDVEIQVSSKS